MSAQTLTLLNLYPHQMTGMGDAGNLIVLLKRLAWRGIHAELVSFEPGDSATTLTEADIILGEGGQESDQLTIQPGIVRIAPALRAAIESGAPALVVGGMYQLFGISLETRAGETLEGAGIFDLHTKQSAARILGNCLVQSNDFGEIIGYENHSGRTYLGANTEPLAKVVSGEGNNGSDGTEGARMHNALGTYLHGPLLPKNPQIADFLIAIALERKSGKPVTLKPLPDTYLKQARTTAKTRPR